MKDDKTEYIKGRGAQVNPDNRFARYTTSVEDSGYLLDDECEQKTTFIEVFPKSIVNVLSSPDVNADYSMNPYQGCEHGCVYCYARPTHQYWGYSAGLDFERVILIKKNAPELLKKKLKSKSWKVGVISLSGNTDCYQPIERKYQITRQLLQICLDFKQPVSIITKNALIIRDLDILEQLAKQQLLVVNISITTLSEELRRILEPRTATVKRKLQTIEELYKRGVPVHVFMAPIIPALNDNEIFSVAKAVSACGARSMGYQIVRLEGPNQEIFINWIQYNFPDRASKIFNQIRDMHGGELNNIYFNQRMNGQGVFASNIEQQCRIARRKFNLQSSHALLRTDLFEIPGQGKQLSLF